MIAIKIQGVMKGSFLKQVDLPQIRQVLTQKSSNIDNRISTGVDD